MKTTLHLKNRNARIYLNEKQDETFLTEQIQEDFKRYTSGTHEDHRNIVSVVRSLGRKIQELLIINLK